MQQHMIVDTYYCILDEQLMAYAAAHDIQFTPAMVFWINNWIMASLNRKKILQMRFKNQININLVEKALTRYLVGGLFKWKMSEII